MIPLILKKLTIRKLPGMPGGIQGLDELAGGINIVAGPNASGKSSTARLIRHVVWTFPPGPETDADASFVTGADHWDVRLGPGMAEAQKNGSRDELKGIPGRDASHRYMLAMHELIAENEQSLARQIARESVGGYDLDLAARDLDYSHAIRNKGVAEYKALEDAGKKLAEVNRQQADLKRKESDLEAKRQEHLKIREAGLLAGFYELLARFLEAKNKQKALQAAFDAFPTALAHVGSEDHAMVLDFEKEIADAETAVANARKETGRCEAVLASLGLPQSGVEEAELDALRIRIDKLNGLEEKIAGLERDIEKEKASALEALRGVHGDGQAEDWKGIELGDVQDLDEFLRKAQSVSIRLQLTESRLERLDREIGACPAKDPRLLSDGIALLRRWTKKEGPAGPGFGWFLVTGVLAVVSVILPVMLGWPGLLGVLPVLYMAWKGYRSTGLDQAAQYRVDYEKLGLPQPAGWSIREVGLVLDELEKEYESAQKRDQLTKESLRLSDEKKEWEAQMGQLARQYADFAEKLKLVPGLPEKNLETYPGMYHFLTRIGQWNKHHAEAAGLRAAMEKAAREAGSLLVSVNGLLEKYRLKPAADATGARIRLRELERLAVEFRDASQGMARQRDVITEKEEQIGRAREKMGNIYRRTGLKEGDRESLQHLVEQLEDYAEAKSELNKAGHELAWREAELHGHAMYEAQWEETERLSLEEVRQLLELNNDRYARLEDSSSEIAGIEERIRQARGGMDLEKALAGQEAALEALDRLFERNLALRTGQLIVDRLKSETREKSRPKVFNKANELFNRITLGRYELRLAESGDTAFRAYDTLMSRGQGLDELSTGTRIQLLLSVRLAFVETQEGHIRLPLLADELLANSDDMRAGAIIDALIEISKAGRQVFYFTAQPDEVGKWKAVLESREGVDYQVIRLGGEEYAESRFSPIGEGWKDLGFVHDVPEPGGLSHGEYGRKLKVPAFDPVNEETARLHLWYLTEDTRLLCQCLLAGIRHWGQLESYLTHGGSITGLTADVLAPIREKARLLERFCELYRKGRPQRIDAEVLAQSGAVSDRFMEPVHKLLNSLGGNPLRLITELNSGTVPGFREAQAKKLENYLEEQSIIDGLDPLPPEEIMVSLQAFLSGLELDRRQAHEFLRRVLKQT